MNKKQISGFGLLAILMAAPMVAKYEGVVLETYRDPVGIPTVCAGETDKAITMRKRFTEQECLALLGASMAEHAQRVSECVTREVTANQAAALVSWSYNIGTNAACKSTLVKKLNAGASPADWCEELKKWVYAGGKVLNGLVARREAEYAMCMNKPKEIA
jgi:lysozyme